MNSVSIDYAFSRSNRPVRRLLPHACETARVLPSGHHGQDGDDVCRREARLEPPTMARISAVDHDKAAFSFGVGAYTSMPLSFRN